MTPLLGMAKGSGKRSFTIATSIQNYGFMAIPLIMYMYDDKELLATLFLHNLGAEIAIFSIGVMVFSGKLSLHAGIYPSTPPSINSYDRSHSRTSRTYRHRHDYRRCINRDQI